MWQSTSPPHHPIPPAFEVVKFNPQLRVFWRRLYKIKEYTGYDHQKTKQFFEKKSSGGEYHSVPIRCFDITGHSPDFEHSWLKTEWIKSNKNSWIPGSSLLFLSYLNHSSSKAVKRKNKTKQIQSYFSVVVTIFPLQFNSHNYSYKGEYTMPCFSHSYKIRSSYSAKNDENGYTKWSFLRCTVFNSYTATPFHDRLNHILTISEPINSFVCL